MGPELSRGGVSECPNPGLQSTLTPFRQGRVYRLEPRARRCSAVMETKRFIYYEEDGMLVGWLEEYPDYRTQGETMAELRENLLDLYKELTAGQIPCVHEVGELSIA